MRFLPITITLTFLWVCCQARVNLELGKRDEPVVVELPSCATGCYSTIVPQYCGNNNNTACLCTNVDFQNAMGSCVYGACNITEAYRAQRFSKDSCGIKNDKSRQYQYTRQLYILVVFTTIFVAGRLYARVLEAGIGPDDWAMVAGQLAFIVDTGMGLAATADNLGQHTWYLEVGQIVSSLRYFYIAELFYILCITLTKLSMLLFFIRIFPPTQYRNIAWGLIVFLLLTNSTFVLLQIFQCVPFHGSWTNWMYKTPPVKCLDFYTVMNCWLAFTVVHDLIIIAYPIPLLWKLNLPRFKKIQLSLMFSLGFFIIACSCARIPALKHMRVSTDQSYEQQPIWIWTGLEMAISIICGCLPSWRSLVVAFFKRTKLISDSSSRPSRPYLSEESLRERRSRQKSNAANGSFMQLTGQNRSTENVGNSE